MFWMWSSKKKSVDELKESTKKGFEDVKKDIHAVSGWIKHLDSERKIQEGAMFGLQEDLSSVREELEGVKNVLNFINQTKTNSLFKTGKQPFNKQTAVFAVQTPVQTGVQTPNLDQFSVTERAILWVLLNTDMKLSYDDLAAMLGKERSTIRGQLNRIKQKNGNLLSESVENNGKKRIFIDEEIKEKLLKKQKVGKKSVKSSKKA